MVKKKSSFNLNTALIVGAIGVGAYFIFSKPSDSNIPAGGGGGQSVFESVREIGGATTEIFKNTRDVFSEIGNIASDLSGGIASGTENIVNDVRTIGKGVEVGSQFIPSFFGVSPASELRSKLVLPTEKGSFFSGNLPFGLGGLSGITFIPGLKFIQKTPAGISNSESRRGTQKTDFGSSNLATALDLSNSSSLPKRKSGGNRAEDKGVVFINGQGFSIAPERRTSTKSLNDFLPKSKFSGSALAKFF